MQRMSVLAEQSVDPSINEADIPTMASSSELLASLENHTDVVSWINENLDADTTLELTELDRRVASLVGMLEIASEDTSVEVERLIDNISRGASRLTYDLHFMRDGALSLQGVLHNVESKSKAPAGADTDAALARLHYLDTVKRNMEAAREVLREAESWSTLESDVTSLLGEKNYEKAAERLSEASKSMAVFENTPEYESRRTLMVSLQNQLEAALSSALVAAVSSQDVAVCRNYFGIFSNIQRETEFRNYYYGSRRAPLVEAWQNVELQDTDGGTAPKASRQTFASFLPTFYASFLSILQSERTSIPAIFPDPQSTLSTLITSTLSTLQPTFSQRLAAVSAHQGATALRQLIAAYRATEEFALAVDKIFEKMGYSSMLAPVAATETDAPRSHLRRKSSARMSMSRRMPSRRASISGNLYAPSTAPLDSPLLPVLEWDTELFAPFVDYQADYTALEWRLLEAALATAMVAGGTDRALILRERAVDVFVAAEQAIGRCIAFTHGYGASGLVQALDRLISSFADTSRAEVSSRRKSGTSTTSGTKASGGELADLDYTSDDWAEIQALLHFLDAVRAVLDRTVGFETKLRTSLVQVSTTLRAARTDLSSVNTVPEGTTRGAMQMLMQSSLNSAALHALLESVDPEPPAQTQGTSSVPPSPDARRSSFVSPTPFTAAASPAQPLVVSSRSAISSLARACQIALQDTILGPLYAHLASYAGLAAWTAPDAAGKRPGAAGGATSAVHVPTFSLSPSATAARVAEGLLSLPRLFEVYADDDALAVSLETLPHLSMRFLRALAEPPAAPQATGRPPPSRRSASLALTAAQVQAQLAAQVQSSTGVPIEELHFSPEAVTAAWLASLTRTLLAHLTRDVLLRIPKLTNAGAAQLAADLGWLANIAEALSVDWAPLGRWRKWVEEEDAEGKRKYREGVSAEKEESTEDAEGEQESEEEEMEEDSEERVSQVVARLRGWTS